MDSRRLSRWFAVERETLARQFGVAFAVYGLYYVLWRAGWTLNLGALWLAVPLLVAECMGYVEFVLFLYMTWRVPAMRAPAPPPGRTVDVYITTYDEDPDLLRSTILGALRMRYPHETYVLDDGDRDEVRALAGSLGAKYIARAEHKHAKAGNINHALRVTSGEFVAVFDADHVPHPQFIERTLGYFDDPRVALVQTPQEFYNLDSIQHAGAPQAGRWHEQALFYRVIQPGKDRLNSVFWCGSSALLRRTALASIGGVATETVTEDILTSIKLHAAGWRTRYHNEVLATGIAPDDLDAFLTQRRRWAQGAMQVLRSRFNPLWARGLSVSQRLSYWASMSTYFASFQKLVLLVTPIVVLFTGILPMRTFGWDFAAHFVPYFALGLIANALAGRGYGRYLDTERYNLLKAFAFVRASVSLFIPRSLRFEVTRKSQLTEQRRELYAALPHVLLLITSAGAIGWAVVALSRGSLSVPDRLALELTGVWALYNAGVVSLTVQSVLTRAHRRAQYRFPVSVPLSVRVDATRDAPFEAFSHDVTTEGIAFTHAAPIDRGAFLTIEARVPPTPMRATAVVMNSTPVSVGGATAYRVGARFAEISDVTRDRLRLFLLTGATEDEATTEGKAA